MQELLTVKPKVYLIGFNKTYYEDDKIFKNQ